MKREDFVFTIGYQGSTAMVDRTARKQYGSLGTDELFREGLHRAAFCSALYSGDEAELQLFSERFGAVSGLGPVSVDRLKRLFGVTTVPDNVNRVMLV
ncbi:MAG: hypothetical protein EA383_06370 [Spirochaetaceae bacterium]|nr:MAG: hypothetical protein EA383_06370 [Spirochaetaceae bacterium]